MMEEYSEKPAAPVKRPFYKKRKYWIICSILSAIIIVVVVCLAVFVFFPMIAQALMNQSKINVNAAQITFSKPSDLDNSVYSKRDDNLNSTFYMNMQSGLSNTGPFAANIKFHNPIDVYYNDTILGNIYLFNDTTISGGKGALNAITPFMIKDEALFAAFAKEMLAVESFKWTLKGKLDITALTRTATVDLNKEITLNGMNGFPDVKISSFQLPGDDPNGGILVELGTVLNSPSPIGVQLGTISLAIGYDGVSLGTVKADGVNLAQGDNNILLKGTLVPHNDTESLDKVGTLFSNYVSGVFSNTTAVGLSCAPDGVNPVGWLSDGFKTVQLNVALGVEQPLQIIKGVQMGYIDLKFDPSNPYSPTLNAPAVNADFQIPFGFTLNITEVNQNITLGINQTSADQTDNFAVIQVPNVPAKSDQSAGTLGFAMNNNAIAGIGGQEAFFNDYTYALTASNNYTFMVAGNASTTTVTPLGTIKLGGIQFFVPTTLHGMQFLNSSATVINSLDVTGGSTDALQLTINCTMTNPSDFSINTGDAFFKMGASGTDLGLITLKNLSLARGDNTVMASATFDPKSSEVGQNLLSTFIMGSDNAVTISGFENSTAIASLANALGAIDLGSTLPGLKTALVQGSSLTVNQDTPQTGVVGVKVTIADPFSAGLTITKVVSAVTFDGMPIGNIDQDISSSPFVVGGKTTGESAPLNMAMNIEPASIALLLRSLAVKSNMDTTALDSLLGLGGFNIAGQQEVHADASVFQGFNISQYTMDAMKALKVDLSLTSGTLIGQYQNDLSFSQKEVAVTTDSSVLILIPIVGQPIVQQIVDGAVLAFETIMLSEPTDSQFTVEMKGSITNAGPMDANIGFPSPLTVSWNGVTLGTVTMPTIASRGDVGANFDVKGTFTIANSDDMGKFAGYMINNQNFKWDITTNDVSVDALGFTFTNISMSKSVTLDGAQGFKDCVTITAFDLPSNDPAGGITLTTQTVIKNPSQVGFNLAGAGFDAYFGDVLIGPLASNGAAIFPPKGSGNVNMTGRMIPQTTDEGIAAVTTVFENYLHGNDSLLTVNGESGSGPNGQVGWLTAGFKTLSIQNVVLPGPDTIPELIPAITMKDMNLDFTKDEWNPPTGSNNVQAQLKSPFGFPLGVSSLNMNVDATYQNNLVASLEIPDEKATTSDTGVVQTQFSDVPFKVANKDIFSGFVQLLTLKDSVTFGLEGSTNAIATTAIGDLNLTGINFNVDTTLAGLNNFGGKVEIISLNVTGGTPEYIILDLVYQITNPSNLTITVGDINFDVMCTELNTVAGRVYSTDVVIPPGPKSFAGKIHLGEGVTDSKVIPLMLSDYLTAAQVPLVIAGTQQSTEIVPLQGGLSGVRLNTVMSGIQANLIESIGVQGTLIGLMFENKAKSVITLRNPLQADYAIKKVEASVTFRPSSGASPFIVGTINYDLPTPISVPAGGTAKTEPWPVDLTKGQLLQLIGMLVDGNKVLDVTQNVTVTVGDGYESQMYYYQDKAPFTIAIDGLDLTGLGQLPPALKSLTLPSNITADTPASDINNVLRSVLSGGSSSSDSAASSSSASALSGDASAQSTATTTTDNSEATTTTAASSETTAFKLPL
ncbi:hypothetical protein K501DRAFT_169158 [Backusella circina FSU 941]|nr:hypothetical protein K501DRAFT_169158 [Backusella circina FSU 941]